MSSRTLAELSALRAAIDERISRVRSGALGLEAALRPAPGDAPADVASRFVYVVKVAEAAPGVGKVRARRALVAVGLGERDRVGDLAEDHRAELLRELAWAGH